MIFDRFFGLIVISFLQTTFQPRQQAPGVPQQQVTETQFIEESRTTYQGGPAHPRDWYTDSDKDHIF